MAITANHLLTTSDGTDQTDYTTASISPTANRLIVVGYSTRRDDTTSPDIPTATGNGLTYTLIEDLLWDNGGTSWKRIFLFAAWSGASPSAGGITFNHTAGTQTHGHWSITEFDGTDGVNGVAQTFVQVVSTPINASGMDPLPLTLAAAANANNRPYCVMVQNASAGQPDAAPGSGWTLLGQSASQDVSRMNATWRSDAFDTTPETTWGGVDSQYGALGAEIKAAAVAATRRLQVNVSPRRW